MERVAPFYATEDGLERIDADRAKLSRLELLLSEIDELAKTGAQAGSVDAATAAAVEVLQRVAEFASFKEIADGAVCRDLAENALIALSAAWAVLAEAIGQAAVDIGSENFRSLAEQQREDLSQICFDAQAICTHIAVGDHLAAWRICRHRLGCDEIVPLRPL